MGISDEDYARAIQENRIKQLELVLKQREEKEKAITITSANPYVLNSGVTLNSMSHPVGLKVITEENLQHDAMKAPLSALIDMWTMRWSGEWVNEKEFDEDDFWRLALVRLLGASKLEKHNLADQHRSVYRIIE